MADGVHGERLVEELVEGGEVLGPALVQRDATGSHGSAVAAAGSARGSGAVRELALIGVSAAASGREGSGEAGERQCREQ